MSTHNYVRSILEYRKQSILSEMTTDLLGFVQPSANNGKPAKTILLCNATYDRVYSACLVDEVPQVLSPP